MHRNLPLSAIREPAEYPAGYFFVKGHSLEANSQQLLQPRHTWVSEWSLDYKVNQKRSVVKNYQQNGTLPSLAFGKDLCSFLG